jgi:branched-chain amino acid transport system substrate-binding protein
VTTAVIVATAGALALTGCSSSKKSAGSGGTSGGLGGGGSSSAGGGAKQTYKLGFQGALSGDNKQLGINEVNSFNLAIKQANASGSLPFKLVGVSSDDGGDNNKSKAAAAKLIGDPAVVGVVGPIFSGPTSAAGADYSAADMALISPSATNETLTSSGFKTFHRIVPTDGIEGKATADYLANKFKNVFVVDDTTVYGKGVADVVYAELQAKKVTVKRQGTNGDKDTNLGPIATAVKSSGAQAIYFGGYDAEGALLAKALKAANFTGLVIGGNGVKSSLFTQTAGPAGNGFYFACGCQDATTAPSAKTFSDAYTAAYGTPPSTYSPEAFDATNALIEAMKTAASSGSVTRAAVETAVTNLDYKGITTEVKFAPNGEVAQATVNLYQQKNGKIVELGDITTQK